MTTTTCQAEFGFTDFDGTHASAPCGSPATRRVTTRSGYMAAYIASVGGWDAYRASCLADGEDPGDDPGRQRWGDLTMLLCDSCADDYVANQQAGDEYEYVVLSDDPIRELLVQFGHDDAGPFYRVLTDDADRIKVAEFANLNDAAHFAYQHNQNPLPCNIEFGKHEHDDIECARLLGEMSGGSYYEGSTWNDTWADNMNTSSHIGFSVF